MPYNIISEIKLTNVKGVDPLTGKDLKDFQIFLDNFADKIVKKWIDYFVYHIRILR